MIKHVEQASIMHGEYLSSTIKSLSDLQALADAMPVNSMMYKVAPIGVSQAVGLPSTRYAMLFLSMDSSMRIIIATSFNQNVGIYKTVRPYAADWREEGWISI